MLYKGLLNPAHFKQVIAAEGEVWPVEVEEESCSSKRYKSNITSQVVFDNKDVTYVDVVNTINFSSLAEKDVNNSSRTAENRQAKFMTPNHAASLLLQSSRPTPERTIRRLIFLLARRPPTSLSRRELLDKFSVFLQQKQKYRRVLMWLETIEAQPTENSDVEMAANVGKGKKKAFINKNPPKEEEDWDKQIERRSR
jgi:hypothetical protein